MDPDSDITSQSKRVSNGSSAMVSTVDDKRLSTITNEKNADIKSSESEPSETNGIKKLERKSKNLSDEISKQEVVPTEEKFDHNDSQPSTELINSNEIQVEAENHNTVIEGRQKSEGCCGCFVEVCYCVTWYWRIMTDSIVSCFRRCNLCRKCGKSPDRSNEDSDGHYFYNGLNFNNEVDRDACGNIIEVNETPNISTNDPSVHDGNDGGYDNCGVDASVYDNCGIDKGSNDNSGVDGGGNDNSGVEGSGDTSAGCDS